MANGRDKRTAAAATDPRSWVETMRAARLGRISPALVGSAMAAQIWKIRSSATAAYACRKLVKYQQVKILSGE
jgi:hypothetical protein